MCKWLVINRKLWKVFDRAQRKLNKELDIAKIIVKLRNLNLCAKEMPVREELKEELE